MKPALEFTDYDTRLAAYAVIVEDDQILLSWYNGRGRGEPCWTLPGGGVDFEETCEDGALREIKEETGYDAELTGMLTVNSWTLSSHPEEPGRRPYKALRVVFGARVVGGTLGTLEVGGSTDEARWLPLADIEGEARADIVGLGIDAWRQRQATRAALGEADGEMTG